MSTSHTLAEWNSLQELAEQAIPMLGKIYRENNLIITICDKPMQNVSHLEIISDHKFASKYLGTTITLKDTFPILQGIFEMRDQLNSTRLDVGKIAHNWQQSEFFVQTQDAHREQIGKFLQQELKPYLERQHVKEVPKDVVLYGFGRIGRIVARMLIEKTGGGDKMLLRAIVVRDQKIDNDLEKRAQLLERDSVHGPFEGVIEINKEKKQLIVNGNVIQFIYANRPSEIDYTQYGINNAVIVDNTGAWRDRKGLSLHLEAKGASEVILSAPAKGVPNVVYGVNDHEVDVTKERIYSAASCTTNAIVPILKVMHDKFHINHVHCETIHSYTNDQNLIDGMHSKPRRGRSAPMNMVLTNTGAAEAVALALPELTGKVSGNAVRVPTPNVSIAILMMNVASVTSKTEVNDYLHEISLNSRQIGFDATGELVSTDVVGDRHAGVVDADSTIVEVLSKEGEKPMSSVIVYCFYDNESGYSAQLVRVLQKMTGKGLRS